MKIIIQICYVTIFMFASMVRAAPVSDAATLGSLDPAHKSNRVPDLLIKEVVKVYHAKGIPPAIALLDKKARIFMARENCTHKEIYHFYGRIYKEAQTRSGSNNVKWSAAIFGWLYSYMDEIGKHTYANGVSTCLISDYFLMGRMGEARKILDEQMKINRRMGKVFDLSQLPDLGRAYPLVPEIRKYKLTKDQISMRIYPRLAQIEMITGLWKESITHNRAMHDALMEFIVAHPNNKIRRANDIDFEAGNAAIAIADTFRWLGFYEESAKQYKFVIEYPWMNPYGGSIVTTSQHKRLQCEIALGRVTPQMPEELSSIRKTMKGNVYMSRHERISVDVTRVDALFSLERKDEAWILLNQLFEKEDRSDVRASFVKHSLASGRMDQVEELLIQLLNAARKQGNKPEEIKYYRLYIDFLTRAGRIQEALKTAAEYIRLLESFDVYTRLPQAHITYARLLAMAGNLKTAKHQLRISKDLLRNGRAYPPHLRQQATANLAADLPKATHKKEPLLLVDLQPKKSIVSALVGFPARGILSVSNPNSRPMEGSITFHGLAVKSQYSSESSVATLNVDLRGNDSANAPLKLLIEGEGVIFLDLQTAVQQPNEKGILEIKWTPTHPPHTEEGKSQTVTWEVQPPEQGEVKRAIVDAGQYKANPYYSIPIHHLLQSRATVSEGEEGEDIIDFQILSSQPTRIEVYDAENNLVMVDAQGDGKYDLQGDVIVQDANANSLPDIAVPLPLGESRFVIYLQPNEPIAEDGITLTLKIKDTHGKWITLSEDNLLPRTR